VILDKYHLLGACRETVGDFLADRWIDPPLRDIDRVGVYFRKE
jgi:Macrocin-O-methyltransferase (TylF)